MKKFFLILFFIIIIFSSYSQQNNYGQYNNVPANLNITGKVMDSSANQPVEYANIVLYRVKDSSMVTGTVTKPDGTFIINELKPGRYYLTANFIGYFKKQINDIRLKPETSPLNLGIINLKQADIHLNEVQVTADKPTIEYKIDKKIINVSQQLTSSGGTAVDVLENAPSVNVDADGNVTLRGSENFTVLIDGKPTFLKGSEALQQIPASTIDNIEIITNPSAKYDPEGIGGIINVIQKKETARGMNGIINASAGTGNKYRGDFTLNYRKKKYKISGGMNYNNTKFGGTGSTQRNTFIPDTSNLQDTIIKYMVNTTDRNRVRQSIKFNSGFEYYLNDSASLSLNGEIGNNNSDNNQSSRIENYQNNLIPHRYEIDQNSSGRGSNYFNVSSNFQKLFPGQGHKLLVQAFYTGGNAKDAEYQQYDSTNENWVKILNKYIKNRSNEDETSGELRLNADYSMPFSQTGKLETGWQTRFEFENESYDFENYNIVSDQWIHNNLYSSRRTLRQTIHAVYFTFSNEIIGIQYQLGLRGEYSNRNIQYIASIKDTSYILNHFDLFPSIHFSKKIGQSNQVMASYSRRVDRPEGRDLEPFISYIDAYTIRRGNPALKPEFTDSYELSYQKNLGTSFVSIEGFYRITNDKIERMTQQYNDSINLLTVGNMKDYSLGGELMANIDVTKWFRLVGSASVFDYRLKGNIAGENRNNHNTNWNSRISTTFRFSPDSKLQIDGFLNGNAITAQGTRKGFMGSNIAYKQDFFSKKLSATLQIRNLLGTMKFNINTTGAGFSEHNLFKPEPTVVMLSLSYKINNYKKQEQQQQQENNNDNEGIDY